jgi:hypothetical protein
MQLFTLFGSYDYEGDTLLGVFSTHEKALKAQEVFNNHKHFIFDSYYIDESVLDEHWDPESSDEQD